MSAAHAVHRVYGVVGVTLVVAVAASLSTAPAGAGVSGWSVLALAACFGLVELLPVHVEHRQETLTLSLSSVPLVIGLFTVPPLALLAARLLGSGIAMATRRPPHYKLATNVAGMWLETAVALLVFDAFGAATGIGSWMAAFAAALAGDFVCSVVLGVAITAFLGRWEAGLGVSHLVGAAAVAVDTCVALVTVSLLRHEPAVVVLLGVVLALVLASYRVHASLRARHRDLAQLHALTNRITDALTSSDVTRVVLQEAREILRAESIALYHGGADGVVRRVLLGPDGSLDVAPLPPVAPDLAVHDAIQLTTTARLAPVPWRGDGVAGDAMVVRLHHTEGTTASLAVVERRGTLRGFDRKDLRLFATVANQVGVALQNGALLDELRAHVVAAEHQASHDALTGLPNRLSLQRCIDEAVAEGSLVGVLLLDLDRFKEVNDTLGHHAGDVLLVEVSRRLRSLVRDVDTVARLGGDEFVVLLRGIGGRAAAVHAARAIVESLAEPVPVGSTSVVTGGSIGVAIAPEHGVEAGPLLQRADVAMYVAKDALTGVEVYDPQRDRNTTRRLDLVADLRHALEQRAIEVYYQPQVCATSGAVVGVEALARWRHPIEGMIRPDEFVAMAEATGLIGPLTSHVLTVALLQQRQWALTGHVLRMSVNVSVRNLLEESIVDDVRAALDAAGVLPRHLCLEVTESSIMSDPTRAVATLRRQRELGVELAVDDFGTGHSSLAYLRDLPVTEVKIDKSFVMPMLTTPRDEAIVRSIIDLAGHLDLQVVAEGVEDAALLDRLRALGCHLTQGYHHARPLPADELDCLLRTSEESRI